MLKSMKKKMKDQRGLTLVELLAVIVILGIIAAIAVPSIGNVIQKSKVDAVKADALHVLNAGKLFVATNTKHTDNDTDTISESELDQFIENVSLSSYSVDIVGNQLKLTAEGTAGDVSVNIYSATLEMVNNNDNWDVSDTNSITVGNAPVTGNTGN
ncbi:type IV pilin protein [Mesobacillus subterraneus]|uniref:type IV pilin protein n=1 Tax=Mesobacillus subterraneus TaxID=285983 RepID=UPI001CFEA0EA|nr:prepilin-type N-terminal cleavage/methylation domain-containing protein [Mesobacillus subterraneus]